MVKNPSANAGDIRDVGSIPGSVRKIPWRRAWQPTPVVLPGESHGERNLAGYSPQPERVGHGAATQHTESPENVKTEILLPLAGVSYLGVWRRA